ncbi:polyprenyl synthetase family protein [Streptomyces rugosispiralis]|uniref:Polyprenyl synthetase family protein n=1 Tax=Streptomyces rugosispiralis TaxID=2967341 RepID=A0ABT1UPY2_9ACTN|nr:polyprenyl synthetase family protein [Streptomyces rugosispiralis]MCQ8187041.1 polyprenyl synthetase family protein [Streptomyces rugosispiralis]
MTSSPSRSVAQRPSRPAPRHTTAPAPFGAPHPSAGAEAWYLNGHLRDESGDAYTWMVSFLKHHDVRDRAARPGYGLVSTCSGPAGVSHRAWMSPTMHRAVHDALRGDTALDHRVREALTESLAEGPLLPDRMLAEPVVESAATLDISFGEPAALRREEDGGYRLAFQDEERFELVLTPLKAAVPQFDAEGRYPGRLPTGADTMTSYFVPRLRAHGTLRHADGSRKRLAGHAWFEQDWGSTYYDVQRAPGTPEHTWEWAGIQLGNDWEISCVHARSTDPVTGATTLEFTRATAVAPDGGVSYHDVDWRPVRHWTSLATLNTYPTAVRVSVPDLGLEVEVIAPAAAGEVRTLLVGRALWESPATVRGVMGTVPVAGTAFLQTLPTNTIGDIEHYMRRTHDIARAEAAALYSGDATDDTALGLLTGIGERTGLDTAARIRLHQGVAAPLLHLLDNPGRSWRPYVAAAVLCLLDADPEPYRPLTAVTELLHVSALVIDDIQDNSPTRRGRPSVHEVFGTAPAITAGTLGYYTFDALIQRVPQADPGTMLRIYRLYLRDLRAAHAGQALDLAGHHTAFDEAVATGDARALLDQIRTAHRLKTGMLVRSTAEVSAILGGADEPQLAAICEYFEAVGIAYQITDDVADLYGQCTRDEHQRGITTRSPAEDLRNGEVTYPVAHATGLLDATGRQRLRDALRERSDAGALEASELLMRSGAVDACVAEARTLVDETWGALAPLLPPTPHKAMVRALGWYAAQRETDHIPQR